MMIRGASLGKIYVIQCLISYFKESVFITSFTGRAVANLQYGGSILSLFFNLTCKGSGSFPKY